MPTRNLFIIRVALMTGVFLFAAVAFFGPRMGLTPTLNLPNGPAAFRYVLWAFVAIAVAGAVFLRARVEGAPPERRGTFLIIGWALGESAALFGSVVHLGGGGAASIGLGLMAFVFTLVMLPIPRPQR